jgi:3D (Asp-Asp-Asp) domain-containing protein
MNSLKLVSFILCLLTAGAFGREDSQLARVTVYWASGGSGSDRNTRHHRCATGTRLRAGHCAVDPRHIPYGSRVLLPTGEALAAVDTGSAVRNRKAARLAGRTTFEKRALVVDRFFETKRQALAWANSHPAFMPIKIVRPNYSRALAFQSGPAPRPAALIPRVQATAMDNRPAQTAPTTGSSSQPIASGGSTGGTSLNRMGRMGR